MKSVVTAMWQLVVAFGNLIDIIVASTSSGMSQVTLEEIGGGRGEEADRRFTY